LPATGEPQPPPLPLVEERVAPYLVGEIAG
jgi:hypothetical protein